MRQKNQTRRAGDAGDKAARTCRKADVYKRQALYNGILGAIYASVWHGSICLYYLLLSALRGILLSAVRRPARERWAFRCASLLLPVLDLSLTVPAAMMVLDRKPVQIGQIPAIGMAAYTTYKVVLAAIGLKRSKRTESLAEKALRTIAFTDALVARCV